MPRPSGSRSSTAHRPSSPRVEKCTTTRACPSSPSTAAASVGEVFTTSRSPARSSRGSSTNAWCDTSVPRDTSSRTASRSSPGPRCSTGTRADNASGTRTAVALIARPPATRAPRTARSPAAPPAAAGTPAPRGPARPRRVVVRHGRRVQVGRHVPGIHRPHPQPRLLHGQHRREPVQGRLRRPVAAPRLVRLRGRVRADRHHRARRRRPQQRQRLLHQAQRGHHVHLQRPPQAVQGQLLQPYQRLRAQRARVVHQQVHPAQPPGLRHQPRAVPGVRDISRQGRHPRPVPGERRRRLLQYRRATGVQHQIPAAAGQRLGQRPPQPLRRPRDDRHRHDPRPLVPRGVRDIASAPHRRPSAWPHRRNRSPHHASDAGRRPAGPFVLRRTPATSALGRVRKVPSSARRAGPAASGACSRRAGRSPSYWMYLGLRPARRECVPGVAGQTGLCGHGLGPRDQTTAVTGPIRAVTPRR
ncbi:hypothetical protein SGLAM104S_06143 [Streptomyces glaucescens]